MTGILEFVSELASRDIKLSLDGELLRVNAPEGLLSPDLVAQLKERKPEVVNFLRAHHSAPVRAAIQRVNHAEPLPLSFAQQRLWFLAQLDPANRSYNIPAAIRLYGPLDVEAVRNSWSAIESRHEALRTTFREVEGRAFQQINPPRFHLNLIDLLGLPETGQTLELSRLGRTEAEYPFDFANGPLWRVSLVRLNAMEHAMFITMHHIVSDGWSAGVLSREFSAFYEAFSSGQDAKLDELPIQYADFAVWQRDWLSGPALQDLLGYWRGQLSGAPPLLDLPSDRPRPPEQSYRSANIRTVLPKALTSALVGLSHRHGTTLFMTLEAGFAVLLGRYSNQQDICIGTPVANRESAETENVAGFFVNTLVLRNNLSGDPSFSEFLTRMRQVTLDAYQRQALPFELIVEALQPERTLSHSPLFQVMFVLQNNRREELHLGDIRIAQEEVESSGAKFDLTLSIQDVEGELAASWRYATDLFDESRIQHMAGHFETLLEAIVAEPGARIACLPFLSDAERTQLLVTWNGLAEQSAVSEACIHEYFETQCAKTPDSAAVVCGTQRVTYRELNARANSLARELIKQGVRPERLLGLFVERSIDMVAAVLGILKAGGAYVPLDPAQPAQRLRVMLEEARCDLIVTQRHLVSALPAGAADLIFLDENPGATVGSAAENLIRQAQPHNLAYVLFTSGSTGKPKGVAVEHRQVVAYCRGVIEACELKPGMRYAMLQPLTVDASVTMLFPSLWTGGTLHVIGRELALDANALAAVLCQANIDCLKIAPSHLSALMAATTEPSALLPRQRLFLGGEALSWKWAQKLLAMAPCEIHNHYGPTESTVAVLNYPVERDPSGERFQIAPIGYRLPRTQTYILGPSLQLMPIGCWGEIYVGGDLVSRGYINRPDLTTQSFIPNPFAGGRLYKTGDWGRYLSDGAVEFLGRMDGQVKLHGLRIEVGEIEEQLRAHPGVREAVVLVADSAGRRQLRAYLTASSSHVAALTGTVLRDHLKRLLPEYMVPAAFTVLEALPRTSHGKVDRLALAALPLTSDPTDTPARLETETETEKVLAAIWRKVLKLEQVGLHDKFFNIGGDSILTIQIVSRAREAGLRITPKDIFQYQTIAALARAVRPLSASGKDLEKVTGPAPLTPIQERFFAEDSPQLSHFNQSICLELHSNVNIAFLEESIRALVVHHEALRSRFRKEAGRWMQDVAAPGDTVPFQVIGITHAMEDRCEELQRSLDLTTGPLIRVALFQTGVSNRLLLVIHHLVVDGISWRILLEDLETAYSQLSQKQAPRLLANTTSFGTWASLLRESGPRVIADEREYWNRLCADSAPSLPVDFVDGPNDNASAAAVSTRFGRQTTEALLNEAPAAYQTQVNDLLLTALALTFYACYGQKPLLFDLEGHGREDIFAGSEALPDLSRTVGWFTTFYPVRLILESAEPGAAIKTVKEQLRQIPNRGIGYSILRYLSDEPQRIRGVDPQISFNYLGQFDQSGQRALIAGFSTAKRGAERAPEGLRSHLIDVIGSVIGGELRIDWIYSRAYQHEQTVRELANQFVKQLESLVSHCLAPNVGSYTPSDFPEANLSQTELDAMSAIIANDKQVEAMYPLSPSQQGMLFESIAAPESGRHIEQSVFSWRGPFDADAFTSAFQQAVDRHAILRTGFVYEGVKQPLQYVLRQAQLPVELHSLRNLPPDSQRKKLDEYTAADRKRGFVLALPPLMRLAIFALDDSLHQIVWTRHHILMDGWSTAIVTREVMDTYRKADRGERSPAKSTPAYREYIQWLGRQLRHESEAFWRSELAGFNAPTPLATRPNRVGPPGAHAREQVYLSTESTAKLSAFSRQHGLTLNTLVQAAWAILLHHCSGADDIVLGATVNGRPPEIPGVEAIVGLFINSVPVRVKIPLDDERRVSEWLHGLQTKNVAMQPHSYCSTGQIHHWSCLPASLPMFESLLVFENYPIGDSNQPDKMKGIEISDSGSTGARTSIPLALLVIPGTQIAFRAVYDASRFAAADLRQMLDHFLALLDAMPAAGEQLLEDYARKQAPLPAVYSSRSLSVSAPLVSPRTSIEHQLAPIWQSALGIPAIGVTQNFFDLGGHSLVAMRLMAEVESAFGSRLPLAAIFQHPTIAQLAGRLAATGTEREAEWSCLVPIQPSGSKLPIFVVPGAGGNVIYLHHLSRHMSVGQPIYALQSVGLDGETEPFTTVESMASHYLCAIQEVQPRGPYVLAGHSFGAKVAFEISRQLQGAGERVAALFVLDATAPVPRARSIRAEWDDARWIFELAEVSCEMLGKTNLLTREELKDADPDTQLARLRGEFERLEITPPGAGLNTVRGLLRVLKSNRSAKYSPSERTRTPIVLFRAEEAIEYRGEIEADEARLRTAPDFGWTPFSAVPVETVVVPGNHVTMTAPPHAAVLAARWQEYLDNLELASTPFAETAEPETVSC